MSLHEQFACQPVRVRGVSDPCVGIVLQAKRARTDIRSRARALGWNQANDTPCCAAHRAPAAHLSGQGSPALNPQSAARPERRHLKHRGAQDIDEALRASEANVEQSHALKRKRSAWWIALPAMLLLVAALAAAFDWNWLRGPIERATQAATGRALAINGDLDVKLRWPVSRVRVGGIAFANPSWAAQPQMLTADAVDFEIDVAQLFRKAIVLPQVQLERAVVHLERSADGRKNWLLDRSQQDENARVRIARLALDQGRIIYDDTAGATRVLSDVSTPNARAEAGAGPGVVFRAEGRYKGLPFALKGSGGPVLALRDETRPYPLDLEANVGRTSLRAHGSITSLTQFSAIDMQIALRGDSLAHLYPLIGIALPETHPYRTTGRIVHNGHVWRYEKFSGSIGQSDIAGSIRVVSGGVRPTFEGDLVSRQLLIDDLGPLVGTGGGPVKRVADASPAPQAPSAAQRRVLPDIPFRTNRWSSVDADVKFTAKTIRRAHGLPLEDLATHLTLRDSVLTLDPLDFGIAGGNLVAAIALDGAKDPIRARARVAARRLHLDKLFPDFDLTRTSVGEINGEFNLAGTGNSVGRMLATSNGEVGLALDGGEISNLMMEYVGLDVFESLKFKIFGDKNVKIRCGVAGFGVRDGFMHARTLVFDTDDTIVEADGGIDLGGERLDLTLHPQPKDASLVALRSPIRVRGSFAKPEVDLDKGTIAARGLGALALGAVNPLLALLPVIETGPGKDSNCRQLIQETKVHPPKAAPARWERPGRERPKDRTFARGAAQIGPPVR